MWSDILSIINVVLTSYWEHWACFWHVSTSVRGRIFVSAKIRASSRFKRFLCFVLIDVRCFRVLPKMSSILQVEDHWSTAWAFLGRSLRSWVGISFEVWMSVIFYFVCVALYIGRGLRKGWSPVQWVLPTVHRIKKLQKRLRPNKGL
jgi:hypothetical protein